MSNDKSECKYCDMRANDNLELCKEIDRLTEKLDKAIAALKVIADRTNYEVDASWLVNEARITLEAINNKGA